MKQIIIQYLSEMIKKSQEIADLSFEVDGRDYPAEEILNGLLIGNELGDRFHKSIEVEAKKITSSRLHLVLVK